MSRHGRFVADGVIGRAQIGRRLRVVDDGADLVPEELGELVVGCRVAHHVGVDVDRLEQLADLPGALIALLAFVSETLNVGVMLRSIGMPPGDILAALR